MDIKIGIYDQIYKAFFDNDFKKVTELWESNDIKIDFADEMQCFTYSFVIDSYRNLGQIDSAILLSVNEIRSAKSNSITPSNIVIVILDLSHFFFEKNKKLKAYRTLLLFKDFNLKMPEEISESFSVLENSAYNKFDSLVLDKIYPALFLLIVVFHKYVTTIFANSKLFLAFLVVNLLIFVFLMFAKFRKLQPLKRSFQRAIRFFVKL